MQDCRNHQQPREDRWTGASTLHCKLYGTRGDLQKTAKFIAATDLPVWPNKANEKKREKKDKKKK